MTVNERLSALRVAMQKENIDAYIIPSSDAHKSEYVADCWKTREWISGFTGSAGTAIITQDHAGVWTDSRYFIQAEVELADSEFELHKQGIPHAPEHRAWLRDRLAADSIVACDGRQFSVQDIRAWEAKFSSKNIRLRTDTDFINLIRQDAIGLPTAPIFVHDVKYAGKSRLEKLTEIRAEMTSDYYLVTALDEIAWALNLRGSDVESNPVFYSFLLIGKEDAQLFTATEKISEAIVKEIAGDNIHVQAYDSVIEYLDKAAQKGSIQYDKGTTNIQLFQAFEKSAHEGKNIIQNLKAIKNDTEIAHIKNAMIKDGIALTRLFRWLEQEVLERPVPETEIAEKLAGFRSQQGAYHGESFDAIVGYKGNGAIVHYRAEKDTCASVKNEGILLLDSGGQYEDGTTDITRTVCFGQPTEEQKFSYTQVLKGHIQLAAAVFPAGTRGAQLDTLARMHLWQAQLDYGHGTGHGVGFFLNVHEGPQGFATSPVTSRGTTAFKPGMVTSNEPGFYKTDEYGIRIENLVVCKEIDSNEYGKWLKFEDLTLFPIDTRLIQIEQLTNSEKAWLNDYHKKVYDALAPQLDTEEKSWLKEKTLPV